jgi:hypothetical protein
LIASALRGPKAYQTLSIFQCLLAARIVIATDNDEGSRVLAAQIDAIAAETRRSFRT